MIDSAVIKGILFKLGADLCGIAPAHRFCAAPEGFHPRDIYKDCRTVVVFAKRAPEACMRSDSRVVYSHTTFSTFKELDRICLNACIELDKMGVGAVMIPCDDPYEYWDEEKKHGKGILSLKHAGELAGLGVIGRNTLLVNKNLGNFMYLSALLINEESDYDAVVNDNYCNSCRRCITSCPVQAMDGITVDQAKCRSHVMTTTSKGFYVYNCNSCRTLCPNAAGLK